MAHPMQRYGEPKKQPSSKPPRKQWWTINGQVMLDAMHRTHEGEDPEIMYLELIANSDTIDTEETTTMKCENCGEAPYNPDTDGAVCPHCGYCNVCGGDVHDDGHYGECSEE